MTGDTHFYWEKGMGKKIASILYVDAITLLCPNFNGDLT